MVSIPRRPNKTQALREHFILTYGNIEKWGKQFEMFLRASKPDAFLVAESHLDSKALRTVEQNIAQWGWKLAATPARRKNQGTSGGTMVLWRSHLHVGPRGLGRAELPTQAVMRGPAWTAVRWHFTGCTIVVGVTYFETAPRQPTQTNLVCLRDLAKRVFFSAGHPVVLFGDWNMPPEVLASTGWLEQAHACIVYAEVPHTCNKGRTTIDHIMVVSRSITGMFAARKPV